MNKPIIGIMMRCFKIDEKPIQYIFESVRKCIIKCGGEPLLICPPKTVDYYNKKWDEFPEFSKVELESINYWLDMCDGLFLPGGNKFTKFDLVVLDIAIKKNIPILGVCMGMQLMSCYKKSYNLYPVNSKVNHNQKDLNILYSHKVMIKECSKLSNIVKEKEILVNSFHKMACRENPLFNVTAVSEDGIIEAIEMKNKDFVIGVQWHPEKTVDNDNYSMNILNAFITKAVEFKKRKIK